MDMNKVLYNVDQREDTTLEQKRTARDNIGAQGALTAGQCVRIVNDSISAAGVVYIGVNTSSTSPQDAVWSAVNEALDNNRLPVLVSGTMKSGLSDMRADSCSAGRVLKRKTVSEKSEASYCTQEDIAQSQSPSYSSYCSQETIFIGEQE